MKSWTRVAVGPGTLLLMEGERVVKIHASQPLRMLHVFSLRKELAFCKTATAPSLLGKKGADFW